MVRVIPARTTESRICAVCTFLTLHLLSSHVRHSKAVPDSKWLSTDRLKGPSILPSFSSLSSLPSTLYPLYLLPSILSAPSFLPPFSPLSSLPPLSFLTSPLYPVFLPGTILPPPLPLSSLPSPLYPLSSLYRRCEWVRWGREGFHIDKQTSESNPPDCLHYQPNKTTLSQLPSSSYTPPLPPRPSTGSSWNSRAMREAARVPDRFTSIKQKKLRRACFLQS